MFELDFTYVSKEQLSLLKNDKSQKAAYKAVTKALRYLKNNPRHNSLNSKPYQSIKGPNREKIFESYAQQKRPSPYRIFWYYGPEKGVITILNIIPHPF